MSPISDRLAAIERSLAHPVYYDGDMGADIRWLVGLAKEIEPLRAERDGAVAMKGKYEVQVAEAWALVRKLKVELREAALIGQGEEAIMRVGMRRVVSEMPDGKALLSCGHTQQWSNSRRYLLCDTCRAPLSHVRVNVNHAGRRIADSRGSAGETLCGAAITAYDSTWSAARRINADERERWITCPTCRAGVENVCIR